MATSLLRSFHDTRVFGIALAFLPLLVTSACSSSSSGDDDAAGAPSSNAGHDDGSGGRGGTTSARGGSGNAAAGEAGSADTSTGGTGATAATGGTTGLVPGSSGEGGASDSGANGGSSGKLVGSGATGGTSGASALPEELVGIWQETRSSGGVYENNFGESFDVTSGFSAQLKLRANGSYYFAHFAAGASSTCAAVSYLDQSVGTATFDGGVLTLHPEQRRLDVTDCSNSGSQDLATDPIPLTISLKESTFFYGGLRTYIMAVEGGPQPLDLTLLHRPPVAAPVQPEQPSEFVLGDGAFTELQGLWVAAAGTDTGFFDPATGDAYLPELNGSQHQWLRIAGDQYETAVALQSINPEGVCKADVIYYEQGNTRFAVTEDVGGQGSHFVGYAQLEATAARLIVNVRDCDEDNAVYQYDVTPLTSYYSFIYFTPANPPESLALNCNLPLSEWQSLLCTSTLTYSRRE